MCAHFFDEKTEAQRGQITFSVTEFSKRSSYYHLSPFPPNRTFQEVEATFALFANFQPSTQQAVGTQFIPDESFKIEIQV